MRPGDTFLLRDPTLSTLLWVVIAPRNATGEVAIVSLGPAEPGSDDRDVVGPGDHPDVIEDSTVRY